MCLWNEDQLHERVSIVCSAAHLHELEALVGGDNDLRQLVACAGGVVGGFAVRFAVLENHLLVLLAARIAFRVGDASDKPTAVGFELYPRDDGTSVGGVLPAQYSVAMVLVGDSIPQLFRSDLVDETRGQLLDRLRRAYR